MRRFSLLPAWLLSLAAWGAPPGLPPGLPPDTALQLEMARQKARGLEAMRRVEATFRADPGHPVQSTPRLPTAMVGSQPGVDPLAVAERYRQAQGAKALDDPGPDLLVFVSFSMPLASLERLAREAARADAVLVFRGPKDGSLKKTFLAFEPLAKLGARAIIHPEAFTRNRVDSVPVYVLGRAAGEGCEGEEGNPGACRDALRISGDASLEYILERMAQSSQPLAREAERRLLRLRGAP